MAGYPPPYPPPPGPPYAGGPNDYRNDWKYQRRVMRDQARLQRDMFRAQRDAYRAQTRVLRRGSIVGPILLIAVGVIFLLVQMNKLASVALWDWYGRWWPIVLIGVGVIVLLEWGFDQIFRRDTAKPYVRPSIGGGVITLLVLLAILGISFKGIHDVGHSAFGHDFGKLNEEDIDQFLGDKHGSDQTLVQVFPAQGSLEVDNPRGDVSISGTSDDNQIHILLHKEIYSRSDSDAANKAQQLTPNLSVSGSFIRMSLPAIDGARADVIITLPADSTNSVTANHGDVHISALKGPVTVTANHGDVELSAITGAINTHIQNSGSGFSVHSVTGPVTLAGKGGDITASDINGTVGIDGDFFGDIHLEHVTGGFRFHSSRTDFQIARLDGETDFTEGELSADQAVGPVVLSTRNRNITLDRISGDVTVTNHNGKVDLTSAPPLGNVTVENRNGEVTVTLPDQAGFNVHAETSDADIENDFSLPVSENNNRKSMSGTVGKGSANVRITTTQDDVSVKRANIAPLPPMPPMPVLTAVPAEAQEAIKEAKQQVKEAQREAKQAADEGRKEADEGRKEAREAQRQAKAAADEAKKAARDDSQH